MFARELGALYGALAQGVRAGVSPGVSSPFAPLGFSYADHAAWQRAALESVDATGISELDRQVSHWTQVLTGAPDLLDLPTDMARRADRLRRAGTIEINLPADLGVRLSGLARAHKTTLFSVLMSGFGLLLQRLSRQDDIVIGTPAAARSHAGSQDLIGFFVNTLAIRLDLSGSPDRAELLKAVDATIRDGLAHQHTPFERLVDSLKVQRSLAHTPLFQTMFAWQSQEEARLVLPGLDVTSESVSLPSAKFDLTLSLSPAPDGSIMGGFEYDADLFHGETIARWAGYLVALLEGLAGIEQGADLDLPVAQLRLMEPAEEDVVVRAFNATGHDVPEATLPDLFGAQAARTPDAIAVVFGDVNLSYGELDARANQLARHLIGLGAGPETIVAIGLPRSFEMIVGILGVLKAGAAYLPIDPETPAARIAFMLADSGAKFLLTTRDVLATITALSDCVPPSTLIVDGPNWAARLAALSPAPQK